MIVVKLPALKNWEKRSAAYETYSLRGCKYMLSSVNNLPTDIWLSIFEICKKKISDENIIDVNPEEIKCHSTYS